MIQNFRGSTVALVTPFLSNGHIDETALRRLVQWQVRQGIDGILACGTTGEGVTLTQDERVHVIRTIVDEAMGQVPVIANAGSNDTRDAVYQTRIAEESGADAILSVTPYYNKPSQAGLIAHFTAIAQSTRLPVILYHVPGRTGSFLNAETIFKLAEIPNIIGIKEASGDMGHIMQLLRERPENFLVLSGDDALALPMMALGADGVISVAANQMPHKMHLLTEYALAGKWNEARKLHFQLLPLMNANFITSNPIPVKAALAEMGWIHNVLRAPLTPMDETLNARMKKILISEGLLCEKKISEEKADYALM